MTQEKLKININYIEVKTFINKLFKPYSIIGEWQYEEFFGENPGEIIVKKYRIVKHKKHMFDLQSVIDIEYFV